ncbi:hypothetical protein SAMN02745116_01869 [Pilibacter termitis]|uniref:Uncharacterized protein n=1 Tax=Pilibacter termitis TaxID=263852 RepID=A0A1T4PMT0_9ENTE|nr:hypothetical protein [Pilibacter termitis]SJZ92661.1 hypothetical protein SAMN02745116_01869 [Pilibacter termitis]
MNNTERFMKLADVFGEEKLYVDGGYYRLRKVDDETFDFDYSLPDPCGSSVLHPQIRLKMQEGELIPVQLFDTYETPVQFLRNDTPEEQEKLQTAFSSLLDKFEEVAKKS